MGFEQRLLTLMMQADIPLTPRRIKGKEQYIVAGGKHKTVTVYDVEGRVTPSQLSEKFDAQSEKYDQFRIFLRVRNLQSLPSGLEGCSLYLHLEVKLVLVIKGGWARAWVQQIYPETNKPVIFLTTLLQEAYFLQLQVGEPLGEFNHLAMKEPRREVGLQARLLQWWMQMAFQSTEFRVQMCIKSTTTFQRPSKRYLAGTPGLNGTLERPTSFQDK